MNKKVVLITTRDYPFRNDVLPLFEQVVEDIYTDCITPLNVLSNNDIDEVKQKVSARNSLEDLIKKRTIGKLFKESESDDGNEWTTNSQSNIGRTFNEFKKEGIPLIKRTFISPQLEEGQPLFSIVFYVLPCTGKFFMSKGEQDSLLRQNYTTHCINLICNCEDIERKDIYAIIHSRDTGITGSDMQSRVIKHGEQKEGAPLKDISDAGHLYLFHHTAGHSIYDDIVVPICAKREIPIDNLYNLLFSGENSFFPKDVTGWWDKLSKLNSEQYEY